VPPAPNVVAVVGALKPNAELVAEAADGPNSDGAEPNPVPKPPPAPNPVVPAVPKAGAVDVVAVLPNPPNPERHRT